MRISRKLSENIDLDDVQIKNTQGHVSAEVKTSKFGRSSIGHLHHNGSEYRLELEVETHNISKQEFVRLVEIVNRMYIEATGEGFLEPNSVVDELAQLREEIQELK